MSSLPWDRALSRSHPGPEEYRRHATPTQWSKMKCPSLNAFPGKYCHNVGRTLCSDVSRHIPSTKTKGYSCWVSNIGVKCAIPQVAVREESLRVGIILRVAKNVPTTGSLCTTVNVSVTRQLTTCSNRRNPLWSVYVIVTGIIESSQPERGYPPG